MAKKKKNKKMTRVGVPVARQTFFEFINVSSRDYLEEVKTNF